MARSIWPRASIKAATRIFYHFAQQTGFNPIADVAHKLGLGEEYELPVTSQFYGTVPDPQWKLRKYEREWQTFDTVNASIGQGYYLTNPLQLAVMSARLATGYNLKPRLIIGRDKPEPASFKFPQSEIDYIRQAMSDVVNGPGTAGRGRLPFDDILMAGKTGTAQVVSLSKSDGKSGPWKYRDHGLFVFFAPFDNPRYAGAVVIEHGGGSGAAYPIARDVMTFIFDPAKGMEALRTLEEQWGGTAKQRLDRKYAAYAAAAGEQIPPLPEREEDIFDQVEAEARVEADRVQAGNTRQEGSRNETGAGVSRQPSPAPAASPAQSTAQ